MRLLSKQIKILRLRANLTQKQLARKTKLSQSTICRLEIDCANTQFQHLYTVIRVLVQITDLGKLFPLKNRSNIENYFLLFLGLKNKLFYDDQKYTLQETQLLTICLELMDKINLILINKSLK